MSNWTTNVESRIFTVVKNRFSDKLKKKYKNLSFKTSEDTVKDADFPTVRIHTTILNESGEDMEGDEINAVQITIQADVTTNASKTDAETIMDDVVNTLKAMRFIIKPLPITTKEGQVHRCICRGKRTVGKGEDLI